jgi:hypothetical protein
LQWGLKEVLVAFGKVFHCVIAFVALPEVIQVRLVVAHVVSSGATLDYDLDVERDEAADEGLDGAGKDGKTLLVCQV